MARPEMTYDPEADAVYIRLAEGVRPVEGEEVSPGIVLDFAEDGKVVGIEFMPASLVLASGPWRSAPMPAVHASAVAAE